MKLTWNKSALADMAYDAGAKEVKIDGERITAWFWFSDNAKAFASRLRGMGFYPLREVNTRVRWRVNEAVSLTGERITIHDAIRRSQSVVAE